MRKVLKSVASRVLIPLTKWYLRKERTYTYQSIKVLVRPGVFHPGLFSSTLFLLEYLETQNLTDQSLLEVGCGSGLISIVSTKKGAYVSACDLSETAFQNAAYNFEKNQVTIELKHSDLFDSLEKKKFDWMIINPPYYNRSATNEAELAWYCGQDFQYFRKLFSSLSEFIHSQSQIIMVLTLACDLDQIKKLAAENDFEFKLLREKNVLFDGKDYLFSLHHRLMGYSKI